MEVRKTKASNSAPTEKTNVHTVYMGPSDWEIIGFIAKAKGITRSAFLREITNPFITEYLNGTIPKVNFDIDAKYSERDKWKSTEDKMLKNLENTKSMDRLPTFKVLCQFVTQFGVDKKLTEGLDEALPKLWLYKHKGNEPFAESTLFDFIRYIEAVMNRRRVEDEIWAYKQKKQEPAICNV